MSSPTFAIDGAHGMIGSLPNNMEGSSSTMGYSLNHIDQVSGNNMDPLIGQGGNGRSWIDMLPDPFLYKMDGADASQDFLQCNEMSDFDGRPLPSTSGCSDVTDHYDHFDSGLGLYDPNEEAFFVGDYQREMDSIGQLVQSIGNDDVKPVKKRRGRTAAPKNEPISTIGKEKKARKPRVPLANRTAFSYPQLITMAVMNSEQEMITTSTLYTFAEYHFPGLASTPSWRNTVRHALSDTTGFKKIGLDEAAKRCWLWTFIPERREELIQQVHKTIRDNEGSMEKLRLRNLDDLPSILNGTSRVSEDLIEYQKPISNEETFIKYDEPIPNGKKDVNTEAQEQVSLDNRTVFSYPQIITMALANSHQEMITTPMLYIFVESNFDRFEGIPSWRNSVRHALSDATGFKKNGLDETMRRNTLWTFIPERREELMQQVVKTIRDNQGSLEKLRMKNIDDLSSILSGTYRISEDLIEYQKPISNEEKLMKYDEKDVNTEAQEQIAQYYEFSQQYFAPYVSADVPIHFNQYAPAPPQAIWRPYEKVMPVYNMPMYEVAREDKPVGPSSHPATYYPHMTMNNDYVHYAPQYQVPGEYHHHPYNPYHYNFV